MENRLEILDLPDDVRRLVGECELTGKRTRFERNGHPVAILTSFDEYLAMRETIDLASDAAIRQLIQTADDEIHRGQMLVVEELFVE